MPMVTITGNVRDHGLVVLPTNLEQRLWFKPNEGHVVGSYALDGQRAYAELSSSGAFTAEVWSEPGRPDFWYTLCTDWLTPGQETEPTEERARGFFEWPQRIFPDSGGPIGDLIDPTIVIPGWVWCSPTAPDSGVRNQLQFNMTTKLLYERVVRW